jgi:ribosomal protein S18 acetylase RimI-like enzyme
MEDQFMIIRLAELQDEEKISRLIAQFRVDLKQLKAVKSTPNIEQGKEEFKEYMKEKYPVFVAEDGNKELLGYLVCRVDGKTVWAESLFTHYKSRREGVGSKLYEKAEELAQELGSGTVYNYVHPNNDKIIPFLSKRGYNVLNLIEIRKARENEVLSTKIAIGNYEYDY